MGVVLGNRTRIQGTQVERDFCACGISHLVAVSGTHLAVVAMLASMVLEALGARPRTRLLACGALMAAYTVLTGLAPSAVRACIMVLCAQGSVAVRRRRDALSGLSAAVLGMLAVEPGNAFSVGFTLSVLCVFGIGVFFPLVRTWLLWIAPRIPVALREAAGVTWVAQGMTLPVTAPLFSVLSLVAPLANLICGSLVSLSIGLGVVGCPLAATGVPIASQAGIALLRAAGMSGGLCLTAASYLASLPFSAVPFTVEGPLAALFVTVLCALIWVVWPLPRSTEDERRRHGVASLATTASVFLALVLMHGALIGSRDQVVALDVGQGDAILVRSRGAVVLVDTGPSDSGLVRALARQHVTHIDCVCVTHLHDDHYGALDELSGVADVDAVALPRAMLDLVGDDRGGSAALTTREIVSDASSLGASVVGLDVGERMAVGRFELTVLSPGELVEDGGNADSLVMELAFDGDADGEPDATGLLTGDAEAGALWPVVEMADIEDVDLLKVGHHGSRTSVADGLAERLSPTVALISCGEGNRYGHPNAECLEQLEAAGAAVFRTDELGDVAVSFSLGGLRVAHIASPEH